MCGAVFKAGRGKLKQRRKKTPRGLRMVITKTQVRHPVTYQWGVRYSTNIPQQIAPQACTLLGPGVP